ncbi:cation diffusion facilitator family transporter [Streptococcus sp. DD12]|uniref:cation diffusion facilitator family transporter n=1 Tax=Streptococcus sp. DD12 TaxID=1777880 RepID=UPI0007927AEA|nr:cation diffusion facilitator family transporter [Streptococcus sp. DD12]KXT76608.1 Cobalt-zinc-cadmium resistance protein [Streptococcus sp. DD12]
MTHAPTNHQLAQRGPIVSIVAYLLLTLLKLIFGQFMHSQALIADGFNNASDIISNITILIGIRLASRPADSDHRFGHWKIEDLASLVTSFIMFVIGLQVLWETIKKIFTGENTAVDPVAAAVGLVSAVIMLAVYAYNRQLAKKTNSSALVSVAADNLSDAVTSIGTAIAVLASAFNMAWLDKLAAVVITIFILKTAYDIFISSAFSLSDGFDETELAKYETEILKIPKITRIKSQRARNYGSNVYLDIVLEMNPDLSVYESHAITEQVEDLLKHRFGVYDIDIHVEPAAIPEDEILENVYHKLHQFELGLHLKPKTYRPWLMTDFRCVTAKGESLTVDDFLKILPKAEQIELTNFDMTSISQKTKLVTYQLGEEFHTSLWRRHEKWYLVFHQISAQAND